MCPIQTYIYIYTIRHFIYFPDTRYIIVLAVWRTIITNPFKTAANTTISLSNSFKPFDTVGMLCPGRVLRVSFSSHPIPHTHIIIFGLYWRVGIKIQRRLNDCRKYTENPRIIAIQYYINKNY